ncbi:MAG: sulfurtransferase [Woeseiaceae bacterium]
MAYADFLIGADELQRHLREPAWRIVDCRFELTQPEKGHADYLDGHIPGAAYAHLDGDLAAPVTATTGRHPLPHPEDFTATLGRWGISRETHVVVYDQASGAIAARLWWMLREWLGHPSVVLLDGGYDAWLRAGLAIETGIPALVPATYVGQVNERAVVTTEELQRALVTEFLLDARDATRFAGLREPIDAAAGHVPGAMNVPFTASLHADGTWRGQAELEAAWSVIFAGDRDRGWNTMCGSGVTACHLALSAELAGFRTPRLYAGSWSEWIRDPGRPVAAAAAETRK